ncbi:hypothetical protein [Neobacillus endophyticus]|nr:hypothetical protein [Neobacillus endophyticus]
MKQNQLLLLSFITSICVILYQFFQWSLFDIFSFLMVPVMFLLFGFFIVITILAVVSLFKKRDWKPITIQVVTIVLLFIVPFNQIVLDLNFKLNQTERE